ncbi:MAG: LamG domain-containing protein [Bacteroidota bacterium]
MKKRFLFSICLLLAANYGLFGQNIQRGLIAQYLFNGDTKDASVNKNDGIQNGGLKFDADRFGSPCGALSFNGTDGYVVVPDSRSIKSPRRELSATVWLKLNQGAGPIKWSTVLCKSDIRDELPESPQYRFQTTNQTVSISTDFTENFVKDLAYGQWYHYALTYDGTKVRSFLNGQKFFEFHYNKAFVSNNMPLEIGRDMPGGLEYFSGSFDDLRIFNRGLSENEVLTIYQDQSEKTSAKPCNVSTPTPPPVTPTPAPKLPPTVTITTPNGSPTTVKKAATDVVATTKNIQKKKQIRFEVNGQQVSNFDFDPQQQLFQSAVRLVEGNNICQIKVTNADGTDEATTFIQYVKPQLPQAPPPPPVRTPQPPIVTINQPQQNPYVADERVQRILASIEHVSNKSDITFRVNGKAISSFTFNKRKKAFESVIQLEKGNNFIEITATNRDGKDNKTSILTYEPTKRPPKIIVLTPAKNPHSTQQATQKIRANVRYIDSKAGLQFSVNGQPFSDFSFDVNKKLFEATIPLNEGFNLFQIVATNSDGTDNAIGQIQYQPASPPPVPSETKVDVGEVTVKEEIVLDKQDIELICFDHQREDGDTVSIIINDQLVADRIRLTTNKNKAFKYKLNLQPNQDYLVVSKAWNLGTQYLNTMTIDIYSGTKFLNRVQLESEIGKSEAVRLRYR